MSAALRADPGDVENSHDYPGFPRLPGFVITDYDEDNPAEYSFSVARPLPIDANHVETIPVKGHRYVIRYEHADDPAPSLLQVQLAYEKLAAAAGFKVEKSGAVGDVSETFHQIKGGREVWISLVPATKVNVLTIIDAKAPPPPPLVMAAPPPIAAIPPSVPEDVFYTTLMSKGRVVVPLVFFPGKPDLDADSQPVLDRVVTLLNRHPELLLEIDGHTDNVGDPQDNQRLSAQRAATVRGLLIAAHIDRKRLVAVGLGGTQPVADEATADGREKNRRIELVVRKTSLPSDITVPASAPNGTN